MLPKPILQTLSTPTIPSRGASETWPRCIWLAWVPRSFTRPTDPFDTHYDQMGSHTKLWMDVSAAMHDFLADLREHDASDEVVIMLFSEFGRRVRDNGTGTDHGAAGVAFAIGDRVNGGMYGTYPSLKPGDLTQGDLAPNYDFRGFYSTLAEKWLGLDPVPIVGGHFEQMSFV